MPGINDFKPFSVGGSANVIDQATYAALTSLLEGGFVAGVADSAKVNKVLRQSSIMAAAIGDFIASETGEDVIDDGTTGEIKANLIAAINSLIEAAAPTITQSAIQGAAKNLTASASGTSSNVNVAADEIVLKDAADDYKTIRNVSLTIAGTSVGANGLDAGSIAGATWYAVWAIYNPTTDTAAGLLSLSDASPTMPSGYTHMARVGWIRTDGTANKYPLGFKQNGKSVRYVVASGSNVANYPVMASGSAGSRTTPTWVSVSTSAFVPATAQIINLGLAVYASGGSIAAPNNLFGAYNNGAFLQPPATNNMTDSVNEYSFMLESSNVYWASSGGAFFCFGWEDNL